MSSFPSEILKAGNAMLDADRLAEARFLAGEAMLRTSLQAVSAADDRLADIAAALQGEARAEVQALRVDLARRCLRKAAHR